MRHKGDNPGFQRFNPSDRTAKMWSSLSQNTTSPHSAQNRQKFLCLQHPNEYITNLCVSATCFNKALCSKCLPQHMKEHQQSANIPFTLNDATEFMCRLDTLSNEGLEKCKNIKQTIREIEKFQKLKKAKAIEENKKLKNFLIIKLNEIFRDKQKEIEAKFKAVEQQFETSISGLISSVMKLQSSCRKSLRDSKDQSQIEGIIRSLPEIKDGLEEANCQKQERIRVSNLQTLELVYETQQFISLFKNSLPKLIQMQSVKISEVEFEAGIAPNNTTFSNQTQLKRDIESQDSLPFDKNSQILSNINQLFVDKSNLKPKQQQNLIKKRQHLNVSKTENNTLKRQNQASRAQYVHNDERNLNRNTSERILKRLSSTTDKLKQSLNGFGLSDKGKVL